jgi:hypothetical protein
MGEGRRDVQAEGAEVSDQGPHFRSFKRLGQGVLGVFILFSAVCTGQLWMIELPFRLVLGWTLFLEREMPRVRFNPAAIGLFAVALPVAMLLGHNCASWLWRGSGNATRWRWKWTLILTTATILMFAIGMAATGVAHQVGWLINSPRPVIESRTKRRVELNRVKCGGNLRRIGTLLEHYANHHSGAMPPDVETLVQCVADAGMESYALVCAAGMQVAAEGKTSAEWVPKVLSHPERHLSFVYCPTPIVGPDGVKRVVVYDPNFDDHGEGVGVMYEDKSVEWFEKEVAREWLDGVSVTATTRPAK